MMERIVELGIPRVVIALSLDGRIAIAAGNTIAGVVSPDAVARVFGLPVFYGERTGMIVDPYSSNCSSSSPFIR